MANGIVKYTAESGNDISLSLKTVRDVICGNQAVTNEEFLVFAAMCKAHRLDPFIREVYLIKYGNQPAQMTVGKETYTKRAARNPRFRGYDAGVTVIGKDGVLERRKGSLVGRQTEKLVGAWCAVRVEGYDEPMFEEVSFEEYAQRKKDGSLNAQWTKMPATMIRKVAIVHALREAFPEDLGGLYDAAELGVVEPNLAPVITEEQVEEPVYEEEF